MAATGFTRAKPDGCEIQPKMCRAQVVALLRTSASLAASCFSRPSISVMDLLSFSSSREYSSIYAGIKRWFMADTPTFIKNGDYKLVNELLYYGYWLRLRPESLSYKILMNMFKVDESASEFAVKRVTLMHPHQRLAAACRVLAEKCGCQLFARTKRLGCALSAVWLLVRNKLQPRLDRYDGRLIAGRIQPAITSFSAGEFRGNNTGLNLSLPNSKSTFSQPFKQKCMSGVVRIGSTITFHLGKLWNAKYFILCDVIFLVRLQGKLEIDHSWEWNVSRPVN